MNDGRITAVAFAAERKNEITDALWEIEVVFLVCAVGMVILFGVICFFLSRALSGKMKETGSRVDALAEGDLSAEKNPTVLSGRSVICYRIPHRCSGIWHRSSAVYRRYPENF